ncbi:Biotin/lipoyl attachment domain-containing protein [uncultured Paludibacter sp.]|nr:Biotin/lipoyl attachment domain-containing protein [uncultured Paludibacter sp.]
MKKYKFTINGGDYEVVVKGIEDDIAELEVNGSSFSVKINQEDKKASKTPILVRKEVERKPGENKEKLSPVSTNVKPSSKVVKSPLPGSIIKIVANEGDVVKEGDILLVMESMKMENNILSERNGTIVKINVKVGQAVLQDETLFEMN